MLLSALILALLLPARAARADAARPWWNDAVIYEIFTRSFQDSAAVSHAGTGIRAPGAVGAPGPAHSPPVGEVGDVVAGDGTGDLAGITSRLDYIKDLGATALWLTPIFPSPSYHGYDATDYRAVNPTYGDLPAFDRLIRETHARGLRVILDIAFNHTSDEHPWFEASAAGTARRSWYVWRDSDPQWPGQDRWHPFGSSFFYAFFGPRMPDLNWLESDVRAELRATLRFWALRGIDGFRLDAVRYYVEGPEGEPDTAATHAVLRELAGSLRAEFPELLFVGEAWADAPTIAPYVNGGDELDLAFHFPLAGALIESVREGNCASFRAALEQSLATFASQARLAPFLTNHDMTRAATQLGGDGKKLALAATALLSLPGTPVIYYGEELGLPQGARIRARGRDDTGQRTPMPWTEAVPGHGFSTARPWLSFATDDAAISVEAQLGHAGSLLETYRSALALRKATPALRSAALALEPAGPDPAVCAFTRGTGDDAVLVSLNFGARVSSGIPPESGTVARLKR